MINSLTHCINYLSDQAWSVLDRWNRFVNDITQDCTQPATMQLFRQTIYVWLLAYTIWMLPSASAFWGPEAYIMAPAAPTSILGQLTHLLHHPAIAPYYWLFLAGQLLSLTVGLLGKYPRASAIAVYFFTKNLNSKAWVILNGGNNLIEIMLFLIIFMQLGNANAGRSSWGMLKNVFANGAFFAARIQVAIVYAVVSLESTEPKSDFHLEFFVVDSSLPPIVRCIVENLR